MASFHPSFSAKVKSSLSVAGFGYKKTLEEMREMYKDNTTVANVYEIGGVKYTVVSHYVGEKDIDDVILKLAESSAYADMDAASA